MTATAQRFLHADSAGAPLTPTRIIRMFPIRQALNSIRGLRSEPKAVLVEVCELTENGKRKQCDATNAYLAERLGMTGKNVSRLLSGLVAGGWITCEIFPQYANRRILTPTAKTRAYYLPETGGVVSPLSAVSEDTPVASEDTPKVGIPHPQSEDRVSPKVRIGYPPKWGDLSTTNNDHSTNKVEEEARELRSALAAAEKKIQELVSANVELAASNAQLTADLEEVTHQREQLRNTLKAQRPASHTGGAAAGPVHKFPFAQSKAATEEGLLTLAQRLGYGAAYLPHYLAHMALKAENMQPRDEQGWQNFAQRFLDNDANNSKTGLITTPPKDSAHGTSTATLVAPRNPSGQKPTGIGGQLARALAERPSGE